MGEAQLSGEPRRFVLHPGVLARLWQYPGPLYDAAHVLLQDVARGRLTFLGVEGFHVHTLDCLADYLRHDAIEPLISVPLFEDVKRVLTLLQYEQFLELHSAEPFLGDAFIVATRHGLSIYDALSVALAEQHGVPLLIADEDLRGHLVEIERQRRFLRIAWLPDESSGHAH